MKQKNYCCRWLYIAISLTIERKGGVSAAILWLLSAVFVLLLKCHYEGFDAVVAEWKNLLYILIPSMVAAWLVVFIACLIYAPLYIDKKDRELFEARLKRKESEISRLKEKCKNLESQSATDQQINDIEELLQKANSIIGMKIREEQEERKSDIQKMQTEFTNWVDEVENYLRNNFGAGEIRIFSSHQLSASLDDIEGRDDEHKKLKSQIKFKIEQLEKIIQKLES